MNEQLVLIHRIAEDMQKKGRLPLVEVHILRGTSGEMLNRGFNGRHKELTVGGVTRARFSSASAKHPIRLKFETERECHTRMLPELVKNEVMDRCAEEGISDVAYAVEVATQVLSDAKKNPETNKLITSQVIAVDGNDIKALADMVLSVVKTPSGNSSMDDKAREKAVKKDSKKVQDIAKSAADSRLLGDSIALFGRMCTDAALSNVYSAIQMNHAYSVNPSSGDYDNFTAVDDYMKIAGFLFDDDDSGESDEDKKNTKKSDTAFLGTTDISSNVYYQYASVSMRILFENLCRGRSIKDENDNQIDAIIEHAADLANSFIKDFIMMVPGAKQNTMASYAAPAAVYITVGDCVYPLTMDAAFERAIIGTTDRSVADQAVDRMIKAAENARGGSFAVNDYRGCYWISDNYSAPDFLTKISVRDIRNILQEA